MMAKRITTPVSVSIILVGAVMLSAYPTPSDAGPVARNSLRGAGAGALVGAIAGGGKGAAIGAAAGAATGAVVGQVRKDRRRDRYYRGRY